MTLDPVHLDGIASLVGRLGSVVDEADHRDLASRVWEHFLDPLYDDGRVVLEPVAEMGRFRAPVESLGLQPAGFEAVHGLDSGTLRPRTFTNGLVLDVAQAAMSATPSDLDLHRSRTVVVGAYTNDDSVDVSSEWTEFDESFVRGRVVSVPDIVPDVATAVSWLPLYVAESEHALRHADEVSELLVLDGPLYPKELVNWATRHRGLDALVSDHAVVRDVVENYVRLVERFVESGVPLVGFVKGARSRALVGALRDEVATPWANDMAMFAQILGRRGRDDPPDHALMWTNWFVSRLGADGAFSARGPDLGIERALDPEEYEVAFFVVYDPRTDLAFKVELPRAFASDKQIRERVERQILRDVAVESGPPHPVGKADELGRLGVAEKAALRRRIEESFDCREDRSYDDERWMPPT